MIGDKLLEKVEVTNCFLLQLSRGGFFVVQAALELTPKKRNRTPPFM